MLRWGKDFVQYGERAYFDKHIKPKHYAWTAPDFSRPNKGPYQDPLEWEKPIPKKKYRSHFPYNIKKTNEAVLLKYLISGQVYTLYETPGGEVILVADSNVYKKIQSGELDSVTEYFSYHITLIREIHFDTTTKTLTDTSIYKFTPQTSWGQRQIKKDNRNQIHHSPERYLTFQENKQLFNRITKALGGFPKYIEQTSNCKRDNFIIHYFRQMGNSLFNVLRH